MKLGVKEVFLCVIMFCGFFWVIPHEFGHFYFRRKFGLETKMWGIGDYNHPMFRKGKFYVGIFSSSILGINLPMDKVHDKQEREKLDKWNQTVISYAGSAFDLISACCIVPFLFIYRTGGVSWLLTFLTFLLLANCIGNLIPFRDKELDVDGKRIFQVGVMYWLICFSASFIAICGVLWLMYKANYVKLVFVIVFFVLLTLVFLVARYVNRILRVQV